MDITLTYTVQKTVSIEDIPHYTLTKDELDTKIDRLLTLHAPDDHEGVDSGYSFDNDEDPMPKGCEPTPTYERWVEIDGIGKIATNEWALVTQDYPPINGKNSCKAWAPAEKVSKVLTDFFNENSCSDSRHCGYFHQRFAPLKDIPFLKVYGTKPTDPGFCYVENKLIAVIMPIQVQDLSCVDKSLFQFDPC
jgi:hypothetical protein